MKNRISTLFTRCIPVAVLLATGASAQVPVDDQGNAIGEYDGGDQAFSNTQPTGDEGIPLLSSAELEELVGPVALYPDDLLAVVLPASTYPLQVVQAARFLEELESNPDLEPNAEWDDSIIALVNYPEVVELLNKDLDWTWRLGEAVVAQQADVVNAVEDFRDRAYAAGNLKSDGYQTVERSEGVIEITPVNEDIIYVPYYEPERVVYYQPRPVYYYYPRPCPVYYYPYPTSYAFSRGYFWGVTTAFSIGWRSDHLRVFHHSYHGHPYYGRSYYDRWWYRRPDIHVYNNVYTRNSVNVSVNHYANGDYWRPSRNTRLRATDQRITRNSFSPNRNSTSRRPTTNQYVNNARDSESEQQVSTTSRSGSDRRSNDDRLSSQDRMRQTINQVQRERQAESRSDVGTNQRQTSQRQATARRGTTRNLTEQRTSRRSTPEQAVTQSDIASQFAAQRENRERHSRLPESRERQPVARETERRQAVPEPQARQSTERQTVQRQPVQRQTTARQSVQRQPVERQTKPRQSVQRQPAERQSTPRQSVQRQPVERQSTPRQSVQRPAPERRTTERRSVQRETQQAERVPSESGSNRARSSQRSQSARDSSRRR